MTRSVLLFDIVESLVREPATARFRIISVARDVLHSRLSASTAWRMLKSTEAIGVRPPAYVLLGVAACRQAFRHDCSPARMSSSSEVPSGRSSRSAW